MLTDENINIIYEGFINLDDVQTFSLSLEHSNKLTNNSFFKLNYQILKIKNLLTLKLNFSK